MSCVAADALFEELRQRAPYASDLFDIALNAICALQTCEGELSRVVVVQRERSAMRRSYAI